MNILQWRCGNNYSTTLIRKRQSNHIFFLACGCVTMGQPEKIKEDAHGKVTNRTAQPVQYPATLESADRGSETKWTESGRIGACEKGHAFGGGRALSGVFHRLRCSSISKSHPLAYLRSALCSLIKLMIFISALQCGALRGFASQIFLIHSL
jgi:hypothetical protein